MIFGPSHLTILGPFTLPSTITLFIYLSSFILTCYILLQNSLCLAGKFSSGSFPEISCKEVNAVKVKRVVPLEGNCCVWLHTLKAPRVGGWLGSFSWFMKWVQDNNSQSYVKQINNIENLYQVVHNFFFLPIFSFDLMFIVFFHYHLVPLYHLPLSTAYPIVHVHGSFYPFCLIPPPQPLHLLLSVLHL